MVVVGNAGSDPEMRYTPNGTAMTNFSLAINMRVPRDGEWVVETIWVRVTCWGRMVLAEQTEALAMQMSEHTLVEA
jgi:single-strand DNA-binding protein